MPPSGPPEPPPRGGAADAPDPMAPLADTLVVVLAGGAGRRLAGLCDREARAALPMAGRRRLVDYALQEAARAGAGSVRALVQHQPATLLRHLPEAWGDRLDLRVCDGRGAWAGPAAALAACLAADPWPGPVAVVSGARAGAFDLRALVAAHRAGGAPATLLEVPRGAPHPHRAPEAGEAAGWEDGGALVLDGAAAPWGLAGPDWEDLLALAGGALARHRQPGALWRDPVDPDAFRRAWLELGGPVPFPLPPETGAPEAPLGAPDLVVEAGGLTLTVPRFGARRGGRWTLLEDSAVMPGARVAPGARLTRALVAPGAIVPAGLVVGEDPAEDGRWFRLAPGPEPSDPPTVLVTSPLLARRAAERMRLRPGAALRPVPAADPPSALTPTES